jgi:AraC-like DNA-binding protein
LNEAGIISCKSSLPWTPTPPINIIHYILVITWLVLFLAYESVMVVQFLAARQPEKTHRNLYPVLFSIIYLIIVMLILMVSQVLYRFFLARIAMSLVSLIVIVWYFFTYLFPDMYPNLNVAIGRYELTHTRGLDRASLREQLMELVETEKIFCDEDLTLQRLASMLSVTPHQFSEFLNREMNMNFNSFINFHRIEEAKTILVSEPERSIISIALAVGFNSKSVFYNAFMKFTGKSPLKYRKENTCLA